MDIIFLWNSELQKEANNGVILSGKYNISFNSIEKCIYIKRKHNFVRDFWGKNVRDCFAIVGENGAGKTKIVNNIMYTIRDAKYSGTEQTEFFLIFEDEDTKELYFVSTEYFKNIKIDVDENICYHLMCGINNYLKNYEIAYFHNALSDNDYLAQGRCKYDFSLGNQIYNHHTTTYEMHYDDLSKDAVINFYENEAFRIISFLYDYAIHNDLEIQFPVPNYISISVADDFYSKQYVMGQAKGLRVDWNEEENLSDEIQKFSDGVDNIINVYGRTWISYTIRNLIYNVFKELCIPATVSRNITYKHQKFFEVCSFLNNVNKMSELSIYECVYRLIDNLHQNFIDDISYINNFENYVKWMERNNEQINKYENKGLLQLDIHVDENTEQFITELEQLYSKVNFAFPFYGFSFGVSTGEYYFLSVFANLYSMAKSRFESDINVYDHTRINENTKNLLLIFDEADLSLHPKWQRMFMKWLTDFCEQLFRDISIKIIVTTHSPILLSDFPGNSILYLEKYENKMIFNNSGSKNTFGCNIHSLFLNSFFLENYGTIGAFAEGKINQIAEMIYTGDIETENLEEIKNVIDYVGEGIIKQKLEFELRNRKQKKKRLLEGSEKVIQDTLYQLKKQRSHLEQLIRNLEETINDKN